MTYPQPPRPPHGGIYGPYNLPTKSKTTAGVLQLVLSLFGLPGIGRLYAGHTGIGIVQLCGTLFGGVLTLCTVGLAVFVPLGLVVWGIVDGIVILGSEAPRDGRGMVMY
jgi:TM2 domain-containing membrane protein YozV